MRRSLLWVLIIIGCMSLPAAGCGSNKDATDDGAGDTASETAEAVSEAVTEDVSDATPAMVLLPEDTGSEGDEGEEPDVSDDEPAGEESPDAEDDVHLSDSIDEDAGYYEPNDYSVGDVLDEERLDLSDPGKYFTSSSIEPGDGIYERINGYSYVENEHVALSDLRYIRVLHYNYDGKIQSGEIIVNKLIEDKILDIFRELFDTKYQVYQMKIVENFWTIDSEQTDETSIKNDNTSCFNYRVVVGEKNISKHAYGVAIDINPYENPFSRYNKDGSFNVENLDEHERAYLYDRTLPHSITEDDVAYKAFTKRGFKWGGHWKTLKDYQHFQYEIK